MLYLALAVTLALFAGAGHAGACLSSDDGEVHVGGDETRVTAGEDENGTSGDSGTSSDTAEDTDGDGLEDWWEEENFGNLSSDAEDDPDGDNLTNDEEQANGTDPNDPDSDGDGVNDTEDAEPLNKEVQIAADTADGADGTDGSEGEDDYDADGAPDETTDGTDGTMPAGGDGSEQPRDDDDEGSWANGDGDSGAAEETGAESDDDDSDVSRLSEGGTEAVMTVMMIAIAAAILVIIGAVGYTRHREMELEGGLRLDIYEYIRHNPGEHLSGIMDEFDISPSTAQHHLHIMEQRSQVVAYKEQKFKRYYINGDAYKAQLDGASYKGTIAALKNPTSGNIVKYLLKNPGAGQKEVAAALGLTPSTVNWHVKRLEDAQLVMKSRDGKRVIYTLRDAEAARRALAIAATEA
jgi:predicted transcriptional regulator